MSLEAILYGVGALLAGVGGCALIVREFRRHDRRSMQHELDELDRELVTVQHRVVSYRRWGFFLSERLAAHGEPVPPPPNGDDEVHE